MGLDTTHDCFRGAYSSFSRWRQQIAEAAGYCIWRVVCGDGIARDTIMLEWHRYRPEVEIMGEWDETPRDPLIVLFAHSDCEGVIRPAQAGPLADALEELLPKLDDSGGGHISSRGGYRRVTEEFIAGLRRAAKAGEVVEFC